MDSTDTSMYAIGCKRIKMEDCETKATDHEIIDGNLDANSYVITEIKQEDQSNQDMTTTTSTTLLNPIEQEHIIPDECGTSIESQSKEDLIEVFKIEIDEFDEHQLNEVEDPGPSRETFIIKQMDSDNSSLSNSQCLSKCDSLIIALPPKPISKVHCFFDTMLEYTDDEFLQNFRLTRKTANSLIEQYEQSKIYRYRSWKGERKRITANNEMYIFLWYMASTETIINISKLFVVSQYFIMTTINRVLEFLISQKHKYIKWSSNLPKTANSFEKIAGMSNVIGVINGSYVRIQKPTKNYNIYLIDSQIYGIKIQVVVDANKKFMHVFSGEPGSLNNSVVFLKSLLFKKLSNDKECFGDDYFVLGESAYPCMERLVTPYRDEHNLTITQKNFNAIHALTCNVAKQALALLKTRFPRLQSFKENQIIMTTLVNITMAGCILHNICIDRLDELPTDCLFQTDNFVDKNYHVSNIDVSRREKLLKEMLNKNIL